MKTIFSIYSEKEVEDILKKISILFENKKSDKEIIDKNRAEFIEELLSIAKARKRASESKSKYLDLLYFNEEDLRFSTPKDIAGYRAKRLKCSKIVDLCSGIGSQSIAFSRTCKKVLAIELDERKVKYAEMNDKSKKIKFLCSDVLSHEAIQAVKDFSPDIIFCDPERMEEEKERSIDSITPNIKKIIETYSKIAPNLCIEVPPQIALEKLNGIGGFEAEYLSYNNKLNRLDLYFGNLKKSGISVADVSGARIEKSQAAAENASFPSKYIYEVSTAITKAGLENEFAILINAEILSTEKNKLILTSNEASKTQESKAFSKVYRVLGFSDNFKELIRILKNNRVGKVILKKSISPQDYWQERKKYEKSLFGKKEACLFSIKPNNKDIEIIADES
ncbi:hypothetical protein A3K73_04535 [Candidatus Pacearchaeota archaeon RBG_13_36_9]|nr:MAG: hypothetical protein A3K73_04535 [Candidatus Pacearchaeota archaeon RBG_13_36_9]